MPTNLAVAIAGRRARSLSAVREETFLLLTPALMGILGGLLAARNPAFACALIWVGLQ